MADLLLIGRLAWRGALLAATSLVFIVVASTIAIGASTDGEAEEHCVVSVIGQHRSGEFITTEPECFKTPAEAAARAANPAALTVPGGGAAASTFTLGIHYDGLNGTGSSISVVGSSCVGGWWNTPSSWDNRISSSYNGCYRLRHHDHPNKGGSQGSTIGTGQTKNVPWWINNRAESVSYWSS